MAKRRGNPNWGKPEPIGPIIPTVTEFEQVVREYKLSPDQYLRSTRLREWARRNKNSKYIPEPLLEAWDSRSNPPCNQPTTLKFRGRHWRPFLLTAGLCWRTFAGTVLKHNHAGRGQTLAQ